MIWNAPSISIRVNYAHTAGAGKNKNGHRKRNRGLHLQSPETLFDGLFVVGTSDQIVDGRIIIVGKTDKQLDRNASGSCFIMRIRSLADVKNLAELFLRQIRVVA